MAATRIFRVNEDIKKILPNHVAISEIEANYYKIDLSNLKIASIRELISDYDSIHDENMYFGNIETIEGIFCWDCDLKKYIKLS
jgi:hypothetical protein